MSTPPDARAPEAHSQGERLSRRALARLLTDIENGDEAALARVRQLYRTPLAARLVGVTGAPGSGKSTLVAALARAARARDQQVAILSVDPSSPFTGGAILGDRIRMRDLAGDAGVFVRSLASRSSLGGLSIAVADMATALAAAGFELILIETVGAGQSDVAIARLADTVILVEVPGLGDDVQAIKAGILEIADVIAVNKADLPGADRVASILATALSNQDTTWGHHGAGAYEAAPQPQRNGWSPPILKTVATTGEGVAAVLDAAEQHARWLETSGERLRRRQRQLREEIAARLQHQLAEFARRRLGAQIEAWAQRCAAHQAHPSEAARALLAELCPGAE
ncbi:MAG: methylmalonyl Co-A mutase-associated GTPase MeaB [Anaerolineae bacterium]|nr:methylmalonyl Co-A mutase-associated GTPase MeaB [Thermoflexales bacterium]MDW8293647.1 methylmalonyl Co-A mutase-associated GTPase MeaB [Anaerolineae bacterium]